MTKKIEKIEDLQPNSKNHNKGTERGNYAIAESIRRLGAGRSGVCDNKGVMIAGNSTLQEMADLGIPVKIVPTDGKEWIVVQRTDLDADTDSKAVELAYADNRTSQLNFELDPEQFKLDLDTGIDLSFLWTEEELQIELSALADDNAEDEEEENDNGGEGDRVNKIPLRDGLESGSIWQIGKHFLACGDCTDEELIEELLDGESPGLIFADPPYGIKAASSYADSRKVKGLATVKRGKFDDIAGDDSTDTAIASFKLLSEMFPNSVHVWWGANYYANALPPSSCWLVWDKEQTSQFADAELAWTNQKTAVRMFRHQWNGMLRASERGEERINPCQKPIALCNWVMSTWGAFGDIVLDPFCGSGMSILAGEESDRVVYGIEISADQCERTLLRLEKKLGAIAQRIN